jgi:class 3 adenylate cyclase
MQREAPGSDQTAGMADQPDKKRSPAAASNAELAMRVADADRDRTVAMLREHVVAGSLTLDEFSDRMGRALEATTRGELEAVTTDLPAVSGSATAGNVTPRTQRRWHVAVMSGHETSGRWRISGKTNAVAIMGGCDMDLRRAEIEGAEVVITAFAFWGGIKVTVPEGFDVELVGFSLMGGRSLKLRDVPLIPGSPRIVVRGFAVMGGIAVKSRSSRSGRKTAKAITESALGVVDAFSERSAARSQASSAPAPAPLTPSAPAPTAPGSDEIPAATADLDALGHSDLVADGTVTILFSDMVDYAGTTERIGDRASLRRLHEHHRIVREALSRYGGREVKVQGDGFMIAFGGAARAMRCAIDIQRAFRDYVPPAGEDPIAVHIGINTGDAVAEGDDYIGHTVIVASRLADAAAPGEVLVSSLSEQLVAGSDEFVFGALRETPLKGMSKPQMSVSLRWSD